MLHRTMILTKQELGADIPKIAVMPTCRRDVLTLLCATEEMYTEHADRPIITMSMAGTGLISRLCGYLKVSRSKKWPFPVL